MNHPILVALLMTVSLAVRAEPLVVFGGTVHTAGPAGTLENATVIIDEGRILSVTADGAVPDNARTIDASGKVITPGLFTAASRLGLVEVSGSAGPVDSLQRGKQFTAGFEVASAFNPRSTLIPINRIEGVTRAAALPSTSGAGDDGQASAVISGLAAVVNLGGTSNSIDRPRAAMVVNLGEAGAGLAGESRALAMLQLRLALDEALEYQSHAKAWERGEHRDFQLSRADLEAMQAVLSRELPLLVRIDRASDIRALLQLSRDYGGLRLIIAGGVESWMLAAELAAADAGVIITPEHNLPSNFDRLNARDDTATILVKAGVSVAFAPGSDTTHNARNITQSAGNAIADGLSPAEALTAITLAPARMFGVDKQLGSLEPGKEADLVIWPGDPFELANYPDAVIIRGEPVDMRSRQTLLRDRYLNSDSNVRPVYRH